MDKYKNFSVDNFLQDEFFRRWVNTPSKHDAELWETWLERNPCMMEIVAEAKGIVAAFEYEPQHLPDEFFVKMKSRIDASVGEKATHKKPGFKRAHWLQLAAVVMVILVAAAIILQPASNGETLMTYTSSF